MKKSLSNLESDLPLLQDMSELNHLLTKATIQSMDTSVASEAVENRQEAIEKQLDAENKAIFVDAQITELKADKQLTVAEADVVVQGTISSADKERAYFNRHAGTLNHYRVREPCSIIKMQILITLDNLATCLAAPLLMVFRFMTLIIETFAGLTRAVKGIVTAVIVLGIICLATYMLATWLASIGVLNI